MIGPKISIIDYGMGNLQSVRNALTQIGYHSEISSDPDSFLESDALILPGVGAFGEAMSNLNKLQITEPLKSAVMKGHKPILGICLGMQLLAETSEEQGEHQGLSLIPGVVRKIPALPPIRLPHIGWNELSVQKKNPLFSDIQEESAFYFVHSFQFICESKYIAATTEYGSIITAAVQSNNIFGTQFHPERSQSKGLQVLRNFVEYANSKSKKDL
jgi:glutamine amidotransferase